MPGCRDFGITEYRDYGIPGYRNTGITEHRNFGISTFRDFEENIKTLYEEISEGILAVSAGVAAGDVAA
jgi:hypothetical protein